VVREEDGDGRGELEETELGVVEHELRQLAAVLAASAWVIYCSNLIMTAMMVMQVVPMGGRQSGTMGGRLGPLRGPSFKNRRELSH